MIHCIYEGLTVHDVDIEVMSTLDKVSVQYHYEVLDTGGLVAAKRCRNDRE